MQRTSNNSTKLLCQTVVVSNNTALPKKRSKNVCISNRKWQLDGYQQLKNKKHRRILAPTGSGKSVLMCALLHADLVNNHKVIVSVPQTIIGQRSFSYKKIVLPNGKVIDWIPQLLLDDNDHVQKLVKFVLTEPGATPLDRIIVCTHQTLVAAEKVLSETNANWHDAGPISLAIDEGHRSEAGNNQLGILTDNWLTNDCGPLMIATATWVRGDLSDIISKERLDSFSTCQLSADEYLSSLVYLKETVLSYMIGQPEDIITTLYKEPNQHGILFMRTPQMDSISKYERLNNYKKAFKKSKHNKSYVDLVTEDNRQHRKDDLLERIDNKEDSPNLVLAMNIGRMGFDWPECNLVIIDQRRGSVADLLQMFGRALRDVEGKTKAHIVIMLDPIPDGISREFLKDYLKNIMATMMVAEWQFRLPKNKDKAVNDFRTDIETAARVTNEVVAGIINGTVTNDNDIEEIVKSIVDAPKDTVSGIVSLIKETAKNNLKNILTANDIKFNPEMKESFIGLVEIVSHILTPKGLLDLRQNIIAPQHKVSRELRRRGIKTAEEYIRRHTEIVGAPKDPPSTYRSTWQGWRFFLTGKRTIIEKFRSPNYHHVG